jgi:hypothetical protein
MSGMVACISMIILLVTGILAFIVPRGTPYRFRAVAFAFFAFFGHMLCTH